MNFVKLSTFAKNRNITYRTAWSWFKLGKIDGAIKDESGHVKVPESSLIDYNTKPSIKNRVAIYSRVSTNKQKDDLNSQKERLNNYAISNGYNIILSETEISKDDNRNKLNKIFENIESWDYLIVEDKFQLPELNFNYVKTLLYMLNKELIIVNNSI